MGLLPLLGAALLTAPGLYLRATGIHLAPPLEAAAYGATILGAAFLLSWAAEVAQLDISKALSLAILALIAVLPEYAVDLYFAWAAARRPDYAAYATANMTGANRLLVGLGWPVIVAIYALRTRRGTVRLDPTENVAIGFLGVATTYSFLIPAKGTLSLLDTAILVALFGIYAARTARLPVHAPTLIGPAALIGRLRRAPRRLATAALFLSSAIAILLTAEYFAEALVASGRPLGVDEFLLVQWAAPLASEAPEFVIAAIWAFRGEPADGLGVLVSSKVNQWTLLIGTIPLVYSLSLGAPGSLRLDLQQEHELWLTAAQSLLAVAVLADLRLGIPEAAALFALFAVQFLIPGIRIEAAIAYGVLAALYLARHHRRLPTLLRAAFGRSAP